MGNDLHLIIMLYYFQINIPPRNLNHLLLKFRIRIQSFNHKENTGV